MNNLRIILEYFGGIILLFASGWLVGHLLKLDEIYKEMQKKKVKKN
jgi:hypothetical protein